MLNKNFVNTPHSMLCFKIPNFKPNFPQYTLNKKKTCAYSLYEILILRNFCFQTKMTRKARRSKTIKRNLRNSQFCSNSDCEMRKFNLVAVCVIPQPHKFSALCLSVSKHHQTPKLTSKTIRISLYVIKTKHSNAVSYFRGVRRQHSLLQFLTR